MAVNIKGSDLSRTCRYRKIFDYIDLFYYLPTDSQTKGLFAIQEFEHGDLISYFGGQRTFSWNFLFKSMSTNEIDIDRFVHISLGRESPRCTGGLMML